MRSVKRAADDAGEDISAAVFPTGVTPIVRPVGQTEVTQLRALEGRINAAASWTTKDAQLARVSGIRVTYETALKNRADGMIAAGAVRALRDVAKEDFLDVFAQVAAGIKQLFPRDKKRQDALFDKSRTSRASEEDAEDADDPTDPSDPSPA